MNHQKYLTLSAGFLFVLSLNACAGPGTKETGNAAALEQGPVETFLAGCSSELNTYCGDVTPGDNRLLACIYAHEDKLSGRCEYALFEAVDQLERAVTALSYAVSECEEELDKFCSNVAVGEGRLLACLEKNDASVRAGCKQALKDVGFKQ